MSLPKLSAYVLILIFLPISTSFADRPSGSQLLQECNQLLKIENAESSDNINLTDAAKCMEYTRAVADTASLYTHFNPVDSDVDICIPPQVTAFQLARVVKRALENNPEELHTDRFLLVISAYISSFPCK